MTWKRPVPLVGDTSTAAERRREPQAWAFPLDARAHLYQLIAARRDIRRFRPDPIEAETLHRVLAAAHAAPSVGLSQPWRFVVVRDGSTRDEAAWMADQQRQLQAAQLEPDAARHLLDLQLEGIRE
ncbi:MAG TPA: nitroreductase family protein, partial [Acidimicrobiales bacterium]